MRILQNTRKTWPVVGVAFGPGGGSLVAGGSGGFDVWALAAGTHRFINSHETQTVWAFALDPGGRRLFYSDWRGGFRLYDLRRGAYRPLPEDNHVVSAAIGPDGSRAALSRG